MDTPTIDQLNAMALPFARLMGVELTEADPDRVRGELTGREELCTAGSILHGGAVMAFADTLGAVATMLNLPEGAKGTTTIESKTNFLGAARVGERVIATTTPLHRGGTTQVWQTRLEVEGSERLVGAVTQTQLVLR